MSCGVSTNISNQNGKSNLARLLKEFEVESGIKLFKNATRLNQVSNDENMVPSSCKDLNSESTEAVNLCETLNYGAM